MSKLWTVIFAVVTLGLTIGYQNCGSQPASNSVDGQVSANSTLQVNGTVMKADLAGCNYLICANDNQDGSQKCFIPVRMDANLLKDGNQVAVEGVIRDDMVSACQAGEILQVFNANLISQ